MFYPFLLVQLLFRSLSALNILLYLTLSHQREYGNIICPENLNEFYNIIHLQGSN